MQLSVSVCVCGEHAMSVCKVMCVVVVLHGYSTICILPEGSNTLPKITGHEWDLDLN